MELVGKFWDCGGFDHTVEGDKEVESIRATTIIASGRLREIIRVCLAEPDFRSDGVL